VAGAHNFKRETHTGYIPIITIDQYIGLTSNYSAKCCLQLSLRYWLCALVIKTKSNSISASENARQRQRLVTSTNIAQCNHLWHCIWGGPQGGQTFEWGLPP